MRRAVCFVCTSPTLYVAPSAERHNVAGEFPEIVEELW
jgi:hypothetical protein